MDIGLIAHLGLRVRLLAPLYYVWALLLCVLPQVVGAQVITKQSADTWEFDIPAMPLSEAVDVFAHITGISIAIEVASMYSITTLVQGRMGAEQALQQMLRRTGLTWRSTEPGSALIYLPKQPEVIPTRPLSDLTKHELSGVQAGNRAHLLYAAKVQNNVMAKLCNLSQTRPGSYRLALQLRVNHWGQVVQHHRLGSTGNATRDQSIDQTLSGLHLGAAPPAGLQQPILILILPASNLVRPICP